MYICVCVCVCVCFLQLIPGAGLHQKHLGFEWGPGDLLVYETNYRLQGIHIHTGKTLHSVNVWTRDDEVKVVKSSSVCCVSAQVRGLQALRLSTSWGKMKTSALPSCANSSTSPISSSGAAEKSKRTCPAKTRSHSESSCLIVWRCMTAHASAEMSWSVVVSCRFVSISKNYRSVIRACMEELQQNAGKHHMTHITHEEDKLLNQLIVFSFSFSVSTQMVL